MIIAIGNQKGGVGKTSIAIELALRWKSFGVATNQEGHNLDEFVDNDRIYAISPLDEFPNYSDENIDVIFDLSGDVHEKSLAVASAVEQANVVFVPLKNDSKGFNQTAKFIVSIAPMNKNIVIIANEIKKKPGEVVNSWEECHDFKCIRKELNDRLPADLQNLRMIPLKFNEKAFDAMDKTKKNLPQLMDGNASRRFHWRELNAQINGILEEAKQYV